METATRNCDHCGESVAADSDACRVCGFLFERVPCPGTAGGLADGQCVVCGAAVCDDEPPRNGRAFLCDEHREVRVVQGWAQIYTTSTDLSAELVADNLKAEGIDSRILSQKDHFFAPVDLGDLSPVRVLVPAFDYLAAWELVLSHSDRSGEVSFACSTCGETYAAQDLSCASCGAELR